MSSEKGWDTANRPQGSIRICPDCARPSWFIWDDPDFQFPRPLPGGDVAHLPEDIDVLYSEARQAMSAAANSAAVLTMRKILMHVAVDCGAEKNLRFVEYVNYLAANHYVPPRAQPWVDRIRQGGNEATHQIVIVAPEAAAELLRFIEMLLKLVYEYPTIAAQPAP